MSAFANSLAAGLTARRTLAGVSVTYDDGTDQATVTAVPGSPAVGLGDAILANIGTNIVDWMIKAADLSGVVTPPEIGHTITHNDGAVTRVYQVVPLQNEPEWSWVDPGHTEYRIHTMQVSEA